MFSWMARYAAPLALIVSASFFFAGSAGAQDEASSGAAAYEMPDVMGELLASAFAAVEEESAGGEFEFVTIDYVGGQEQLNLTNWTVCDQWPKAGEELKENAKVTFYVKRPNADNCFS